MLSMLVLSAVRYGRRASINVVSHQAPNAADTQAGNRRIFGLPCLLMLALTILLCDNRVSAERKPIEKARDFVGRVEAIDRIEVRARVTSYLDAVLF